jgi:hypothetical protein
MLVAVVVIKQHLLQYPTNITKVASFITCLRQTFLINHINVTNLIHFHSHSIVTSSSTCFGFKRPSSGGTTLASVVPPEDGRFTPETCTGSRHNKVIVKVKVYKVGYVIVIHNDTRSTKCQMPY